MTSSDAQVVKSNHIINASYKLSLMEQRVLLACISKVPRNSGITDEVMYRVTAAEISELCETDIKTAYRDLREATDRLYERSVIIQKDPDGNNRSKRLQKTRWVQTVAYVESEGHIELRFGKDIIPFINLLSEQFTRYALKDIAKMKSVYSIRIYELMAQWRNVKKEFEVDVEYLKHILGIDSQYPLFSDFRKRVIDVAVKEINQHTSFDITYEAKKKCRKITSLKFKFKERKADTSGLAENKSKKLTKKEAESMAFPGESYEELSTRLKVMGYIFPRLN